MSAAYSTPDTLHCRTGAEYGQDLAAALVQAGRDLDTGRRRQMSKIVLREIAAAVEDLRAAGIPQAQVDAFERACRQACRDELLRAVRRDRVNEAPRRSGRAA